MLAEALQGSEINVAWYPMVGSLDLYYRREQADKNDWKQSPVYLENRHRAQELSINLARQPDAVFPSEENSWTMPDRQMIYLVAEPLTEYIIATYGHTTIPRLLDAFTQYGTWEDVAPAVFKRPAATFEEQWHSYLQENYPVD